MKRHSSSFFVLSLFLLAATGCVRQRPITADEALERAFQTPTFVALKSDPEAACPTIDGWEGRPLFSRYGTYPSSHDAATAATMALDNTAVAPLAESESGIPCAARPRSAVEVGREMARYCSYRRKPGRRDARIPNRPILGLERIDPDPLALTVSAETLASTLQPRFAEIFFRQVRRTEATLPIVNRPAVRLAVIDNYPTQPPASEASDGTSPRRAHDRTGRPCPSNHGDFLRLLAWRLSCDDGPACAAEVTTRLALAYQGFDTRSEALVDRDDACGGSIGTFEDLAQAIDDEVTAWQDENRRTGTKQPLILNLSIGWDGQRFGGIDERGENVPYCQLPVGPRAVYDALDRARELGALIFAAAGNDRGGAHPLVGPLLPAAWERQSPREESECHVRRDRPLVYAVGALQGDGRALSTARRPGAMPTLAAYGDHAALGGLGPWPTRTYSGTSVSTAVISSAAAVLWHRNPEGLSADGVVDALASGGSPSSRPIDFEFSSHEGSVRRGDPYARDVTICTALSGPGSPCPPIGRATPIVSDLLSPLLLPRGTALAATERCGRRIYSEVKFAGSSRLCQWTELPDAAAIPATSPQPGNDPCPNCTDPPHRPAALSAEIDGHVLHIEIEPDWPAAKELVSATFELVSGTAGDTPRALYLSFESDPISAETRPSRQVFLPIDDFPFGPGSQAMIHWVIRTGSTLTTYTSPVFVAD